MAPGCMVPGCMGPGRMASGCMAPGRMGPRRSSGRGAAGEEGKKKLSSLLAAHACMTDAEAYEAPPAQCPCCCSPVIVQDGRDLLPAASLQVGGHHELVAIGLVPYSHLERVVERSAMQLSQGFFVVTPPLSKGQMPRPYKVTSYTEELSSCTGAWPSQAKSPLHLCGFCVGSTSLVPVIGEQGYHFPGILTSNAFEIAGVHGSASYEPFDAARWRSEPDDRRRRGAQLMLQ